MNEIKVFINRNGILSKYLTDTIDFNKHGQVEKIRVRRHRATLQNYKAT